jgi:two-component system LytT family response regulator
MRVLIIEDELPAAGRLTNLLAGIDEEIKILDVLPSIEKAVEWLNENSFPDVIFMDIELSDGRCFEIFNRVKIPVPVIFTTAYDQFAMKAIKLNALDYLLKPVDKGELEEALSKLDKIPKKEELPEYSALMEFIANSTQNRKPRKLAIKEAGSTRFIEIDSILRLQADSNYTLVFLADKSKVITARTLKDYEDILIDWGFFRVHNAHLINLNCVEKFYKDSCMIEMSDGSTIEVSRNKKKELLVKLGVN